MKNEELGPLVGPSEYNCFIIFPGGLLPFLPHLPFIQFSTILSRDEIPKIIISSNRTPECKLI
ncbi:hypothetical protein EO92_13570 [Methanosarcina sp. 2.H.A.1B.4]|nr:hypothetical protein EO92_13570 [Methanosarcina sp. 2.H.A.1B.4]